MKTSPLRLLEAYRQRPAPHLRVVPSGHRPELSPFLQQVCEGSGEGLLFWYGSTHVAVAENSRRYRIANRLEQMPRARAHVGRTLPASALAGVHTVIALRPHLDALGRYQVERLRAMSVRVIADYDDLLFACPLDAFPRSDAWYRRPGIARRLRGYRESLAYFDAFTASTLPIAEALRIARPDAEICVVPNRPSPSWVARGRARYQDRAWAPKERKVLRYLPGSPSHDHDFAVIEDALVDFLRDRDDVDLEIVGFLKFNRRRFPRGRVEHRPKVDYERFPGVLMSTWLNLVPLAPNVYSQARSALKLLEAAAFGVPSIATPSIDHNRTTELPSPIRFARTHNEWLDALHEAYRSTPVDGAEAARLRVPSEVSEEWARSEVVGKVR